MKEYKGYGVNQIKKDIVTHIEYSLARTRFSIDLETCYKATALTVRDRIIEVFNDT